MYLDAIKKENIRWPTYTSDFLPLMEQRYEFWTGYYTSRPGMKKQVTSYSSLFHAQSRLFARRMINMNSGDKEIESALTATFDSLD